MVGKKNANLKKRGLQKEVHQKDGGEQRISRCWLPRRGARKHKGGGGGLKKRKEKKTPKVCVQFLGCKKQ